MKQQEKNHWWLSLVVKISMAKIKKLAKNWSNIGQYCEINLRESYSPNDSVDL